MLTLGMIQACLYISANLCNMWHQSKKPTIIFTPLGQEVDVSQLFNVTTWHVLLMFSIIACIVYSAFSDEGIRAQ